MTLDQLTVLCAIVENGGFRAASEKLHRSQSAISIAIKKLEDELQISLFLRNQYRPVLTDEGRSLYEKAKTVLGHAEDFTNLAEHYAQGEEPELRLAMSAIMPVENLMPIISDVTQAASATRLSLLVENLHGTMERLEDGDADIAITEFLPNEMDYEYVVLGTVEFVAVVSAASTYAAEAASLRERDLEDSVQIVVRDTSRHREKKTVGVVKATTQWMVNDFNMKKRIITSGIGWGRMPLHMVESELKSGELLLLKSSDFDPIEATIKMVRKKRKLVGPVAEKLWGLMKERAFN
ncbi:Transcriptional regulator [Candidatus Terasakiella magnetica]|uniref:Transcriptional regulator n=1 Tax=Candidatus Terasakiella magnetica TaxID=1867952 RepID=A0A1C3RFH0_9PROT|nr:LysR family transcriptional regulator [Candidatus Terasakiella magnetica]SCA56037.1 Transcriptional regulator [Candidatus Terasakiella magnetica]